MLQAFDTIMQCAISAQEVSRNNIDEPFRYECLCCGEEVHIAAAGSQKKSPHFRHLRGNSDKDCELYLGSMGIEGAIIAARKRSHNHSEIFFDISQKAFFISISFSEEKLNEYDCKSCVLEFQAGYGIPAYESVKITRTNFTPDNPVLFPLRLTSNDCVISVVGAGIRAHYKILKQMEFPTFFKIQTSDKSSNRAKRHTDGIIYTNTHYYVLAQQKSYIEKLLHYAPEVSLGDIEEIESFGQTIFGAMAVISSITIDIRDTLRFFGYSLVKSEQVTALWPPVFSVDNALCCNARQLFLCSSFELCAKSNISCEPYVNLVCCLRIFYADILVNQMGYSIVSESAEWRKREIEFIHLADTRHVAMINLILQGGTPTLAMLLAGHADITISSHYSNSTMTCPAH